MGTNLDELLGIQGLIISTYGPNEKFQIENLFVKFVFECLGLVNITDDVLTEISRSVTFKLVKILTEAKKVAHKSNRIKLTSSDIDNSLILCGFESLLLNEQVYNQNSLIRLLSNNRQNDIYFFYDDEVDIDDYLSNSRSKCKAQLDVGLKSHWLAISGAQPCIVENPINVPKSDLAKAKDSNEDLLPVSLHLQIFYKEVTEASIGTLEEKRKEALAALQRDPSVRYLVAPLCSFIYQGIRVNIASRNLAILIYIMRMVCSIIQNASIPPEVMEHHFHELIPSIMSCILSPEQCSKKFEENHWALRIYSAKLICNLCSNYEHFIPHLRSNVLHILIYTLKNILSQINIDEETFEITENGQSYDILDFPFGTHFGAIYTFILFPKDLVRDTFWPLLKHECLLFEALNFNLATIDHDNLKRDIGKTELQLANLLASILTQDELSDSPSLESIVGKYMTDKVYQARLAAQEKQVV
ncbi:Transcription initiation factor TFIID subunit 6 [Thelohanellus kitauei]|uniref:Transcription initiation factor TFIID subunit 6 n=1 Tax=Thelohanellus kitauei TaxID=669202 RepID=A0A0C2MHB9_THEKT|nr:Transcription initiation factor TFIID subunit 6 [Thelohanellus kitauei]